jgi:hypothetical protein
MATVERTSLTEYDPVWDVAVLRNVTIQDTAEGLRTIDRMVQNRQYEAAWRLAIELENRLAKVFQLTHDEQLMEDVALMQRYQQNLAEAVWQAEGRAPRRRDGVEPDLSGEYFEPERRERNMLPTVEIR